MEEKVAGSIFTEYNNVFLLGCNILRFIEYNFIYKRSFINFDTLLGSFMYMFEEVKRINLHFIAT